MSAFVTQHFSIRMKLNNKHVKESKKKQDNSDADRHTQYGDNTAVTVYDESWSWWGSCNKRKGIELLDPWLLRSSAMADEDYLMRMTAAFLTSPSPD